MCTLNRQMRKYPFTNEASSARQHQNLSILKFESDSKNKTFILRYLIFKDLESIRDRRNLRRKNPVLHTLMSQ